VFLSCSLLLSWLNAHTSLSKVPTYLNSVMQISPRSSEVVIVYGSVVCVHVCVCVRVCLCVCTLSEQVTHYGRETVQCMLYYSNLMTGVVGLYCDVLVAVGFNCCQVTHDCHYRKRSHGDFKQVGNFEAKFYVEGLRFPPICMDR